MLTEKPRPCVVCLQVRRNLHIVLSFSPVGDAFRERLRKFPSLVNCTSIDWFTAWPKDALANVAANMLAGLPGVEDTVSTSSTHALCCTSCKQDAIRQLWTVADMDFVKVRHAFPSS